MPRKKTIYTNEFPYHICARSNNRENFYVPKSVAWQIFARNLNKIRKKFNFRVHAFVLMDNHYHLIGSASEEHNIGEVFCWFQRSVSREINDYAGRINHVFGGPYHPSLLPTELAYISCLKYVFRNPVKAGICSRVEEYPYSTMCQHKLNLKPKVMVSSPETGIDCWVPKSRGEFTDWLNRPLIGDLDRAISNGLRRVEFGRMITSSRRPFELSDIL